VTASEALAEGASSPATWDACVTHVSDDPRVLEDDVASWPPDGRGPA
jgi:hypothetical protein